MRVREVLMRAVQREISWVQAADILGISARNMRRWKVKFETAGLEGVLDRRTLGHPNPRRVTRRADQEASAAGTSSSAPSACDQQDL